MLCFVAMRCVTICVRKHCVQKLAIQFAWCRAGSKSENFKVTVLIGHYDLDTIKIGVFFSTKVGFWTQSKTGPGTRQQEAPDVRHSIGTEP